MELICRTCMQINEKYVDLFNYYENSKILADMLKECTTIKVNKNDGLPFCICNCCLEKLTSAWAFRMMVIKTDLKLRSNLNKHEENLVRCNSSFIDAIIVKEEVNIESETHISILEANVDVNKSLNFTQDRNQEETIYIDNQHSSEQSLDKIIHENFVHLKSCVRGKNSRKEVDKISQCCVEANSKIPLSNDVKQSALPNLLISSDNCYDSEGLADENTNRDFNSSTDFDSAEELGGTIIENQEDTYIENELTEEDINEILKDDEYFNNNSYNPNAEIEMHSESRNKKLTRREKQNMSIFCKICNRSFSYRYYFEAHVREHNGSKQCKCEVCGKTFVWPFQLRVHMVVHSDARPFSCEICSKTFKNRITLVSHKAVHSKDTPYNCNICQKSFKSKILLTNHSHRHGKTYTCEVCGKLFRGPSDLRNHQITHMDEKKVECATCGKTFKTKHGLSKHLKTHSDARPYSCSYCDKRFKTKEVLDSHILIHTGEKPYSCKICDKSFRHLATLHNHMRIHTGETPYSCKLCQSQFKYSHHLQNHMRVHK